MWDNSIVNKLITENLLKFLNDCIIIREMSLIEVNFPLQDKYERDKSLNELNVFMNFIL